MSSDDTRVSSPIAPLSREFHPPFNATSATVQSTVGPTPPPSPPYVSTDREVSSISTPPITPLSGELVPLCNDTNNAAVDQSSVMPTHTMSFLGSPINKSLLIPLDHELRSLEDDTDDCPNDVTSTHTASSPCLSSSDEDDSISSLIFPVPCEPQPRSDVAPIVSLLCEFQQLSDNVSDYSIAAAVPQLSRLELLGQVASSGLPSTNSSNITNHARRSSRIGRPVSIPHSDPSDTDVRVELLHAGFKQLVSTKFIAAGTFIKGGDYTGCCYYTDELAKSDEKTERNHDRDITPRRLLNNRQITLVPSSKCKAAVANDAAMKPKLSKLGQTNNAFLWEEFCPLVNVTDPNFLRLYAITDIQKGEPINWRYGIDYWLDHYPGRSNQWVRKNYSPISVKGTLFPLEIQERFSTREGVKVHGDHKECQVSFLASALSMPLRYV
jgi:hypothetical protein